jgi:hypothetical protein
MNSFALATMRWPWAAPWIRPVPGARDAHHRPRVGRSSTGENNARAICGSCRRRERAPSKQWRRAGKLFQSGTQCLETKHMAWR